MRRLSKFIVFVLITAFSVMAFQGCGRKPKKEPVPMPDVRSPDISTAIEVPGVPYPVIPNELVVMLKEGKTLDSFKKSLEDKDIKVVGQIPAFRIVQLEVPSTRREEIKKNLRKNPNVEAVVYQSLFESYLKLNDPVFTNDDPYDDWNLKAINAESAWDITKGDPNIVIAIVDTGTLLGHEELKGKIVFSGSRWTDDGSHTGTAEELSHGTHVAITAAGNGDNGKGTSGVAPGCSVMPVQVGFSLSNIMAGVSFAAQNGADVINLSMGPRFLNSYVEDYQDPATKAGTLSYFLKERRQDQQVINKTFAAVEAMGSVVIVAAGNHTIPGDFNAWAHSPFSLAVGAVGMTGEGTIAPPDFSNYGYMVRVSAPGYSIYSGIAETPSSYEFMGGTSMAAPHVSGLAGLILSVNPKLTPREVRQVIIASAFTEGKEGGLHWYNEPRWIKKEMDSWRKAFLLLMGEDENLLLDDLAQYYMLSLIPVEYNSIWAEGRDAVGAFIDAKAALELAKSGEFRKMFATFSEEEYKQASQLKPERLAQVQNMLKFKNRYAASLEMPSFELKFSDELDRLIVVRDKSPGPSYSEWLECIEPGRYRHFAKLGDQDYSQGAVQIVETKAGITLKNLRRKIDRSYTLVKDSFIVSEAPEGFHTIAGGSEPNTIGKLLIKYIDPKERPVKEEILVYPAGAPPVPEEVVFTAFTGEAVDLLTGRYDIKILSDPVAIWFKDVEIKKGETLELEAGGYGKILIKGKDTRGEPNNVDFSMYAPEDEKMQSAVARGTSNEPLDVVAGRYNVYVSITRIGSSGITYEGIEIKRGETTEVNLPQLGSLLVSGDDPVGEPVSNYVFISTPENKDRNWTGRTNEPKELIPGTYYVRVDMDPDIPYDNVEIRPGETTEIKLPKWGRLDIRMKDNKGKPVNTNLWIYTPEDSNNSVTVGYTNTPIDLPPGEYDIKVWNYDKEIKTAEVKAGETTVVNLRR